MASKHYRALYFVFVVSAALLLAWAWDATVELSRSDGLWLEILILVAVSAFFFEPRFVGGAGTVANAVAVIFVVLGADYQTLESWWSALLVMALGVLVASLLGYLLAGDGDSRSGRNRAARECRRLARWAGSWQGVLLLALGLALATFDPALGPEWATSAVTVLLVLVLAKFPPHEVAAYLRGSSADGVDLFLVKVAPPNEAIVGGSQAADLAPGTRLRFTPAAGPARAGIVVDIVKEDGHAAARVVVKGVVALLATHGSGAGSAVAVDLIGDPETSGHSDPPAVDSQVKGLFAEGSSMSEGVVELLSSTSVELGDVLWTGSEAARTYWQVTEAGVVRSTWAGDARRSVEAKVLRVGQWNSGEARFDGVLRSPTPSEIAQSGEIEIPAVNLGDERSAIGRLPNSPFPVVVDVSDLSRHHGAILGTTGTGKTHLSFALVEAMAGVGVKVICIDQTGQYAARFTEAEVVRRGGCVAFLDGASSIAVYELDPARSPINEVNELAANLKNRFAGMDPLEPGAPARCVLVLEEAHNFVPESFVIDDWDLKARAQNTSQLIMESRKFGLGFLLVTQRTAMITKSALSQCNTVFAFQAVDQTGIDYLQGMCGPALARSLPSLPHRTAVVMGRALTSTAPVICHTAEAEQVVY